MSEEKTVFSTDIIKDAISLSIKEGKWLDVVYASKKENRDTFFWCYVRDADSNTHRLYVDIFNDKKSLDTIHSWISFDKIKEARVIDFTYGGFNETLYNKISHNVVAYDWLSFDRFNNNVLRYLEACNRLDSDPYVEHYTMIEGLDADALSEKGVFFLDEDKTHEIVSFVKRYDINADDRRVYELSLSRLSIDEGNKKYIVLFQSVRFSPADHSLVLLKDLRLNPSFLVEGRKHSLSRYTELSSEEFLKLANEDFLETSNILRASLNPQEIINTRPDFFLIAHDLSIPLHQIFLRIEKKNEENTLSAPLKAFFGDSSIKNNGRKKPNIVLFDNHVNGDQALLIYSALKNKVTYVQGPPGTGKTQTIFNTLLSAYFADKKVLVSTNNNHPLEGLIERIDFTYEGNPIPFPFLRLGNSSFVAEALKKIKHYYEEYHTKETWTKEKLESVRKEVFEKNAEAVSLLTHYQTKKTLLENRAFLAKAATFGAKGAMIEKEQKRIEEELKKIPSFTEEDLIHSCLSLKNDEKALSYLYYSSLYHIKKLSKSEYNELRSILANPDPVSAVSAFNAYTSLDKNLALLTDVFPLIFTTNISASRLGRGDFLFDMVVMDEAGQADICHALLPISKGESLLLVGDEDQLLPVITLDPSVNEALKKEYQIADIYDYLSNSILSTMKQVDSVSGRVMLRTHYRCGKKIIRFNNRYFYKDALRVPKTLKEGEVSLYSVTNLVRPHIKNTSFEEAKNVVNYCKERKGQDIAIITPFVNQANLINTLLEREGIDSIKASTIHSVQGSEKETIVISTGISPFSNERTMDWMNSHAEIANVAVSRAKRCLVVFSDDKSIERLAKEGGVWNELIHYCKENGNAEVIPPRYESMAAGKSNGSLTEEEFNKTIEQILSVKKKLMVKRNVPLEEVLGNEFKGLGYEFDSVIYEKSFLFNIVTPCFAFEFDGSEHYRNKATIARDKKKEELAKKKNLRIIRLDNRYSKDYEFLKLLIEHYSKEKEEDDQLYLF